MALVVRVLALAAAVTAVLEMSSAAVYKVGDSAGWTTFGNVNYKQWAASKTFQLGDVIRFEYNPQLHNVIRVTHAMYRSCNASLPLDSYTTGNDTITITTRGHYFYMCGVPGHCQAGQKVDINAMRHPSSAAPTPSALAPPTVPAPHAPTPGPSIAAPLQSLKGNFGLLGLTLVVSGLA
ncbi:hypothetical protein ACFX2I_012408 [Malus domestica]|uniref:Phytocyanin domain-containing protein n=1 Tax=Malus domestica TaxID=3750 RepID=A0A498IE46_MALDO|nr:mavicyanin-like [Malus domestica]XP_050119872.1 mavicyanin-like [Malus sylvestris]RXH80392.1 hypothetical protein DVH24_041539 [Malus domestica]